MATENLQTVFRSTVMTPVAIAQFTLVNSLKCCVKHWEKERDELGHLKMCPLLMARSNEALKIKLGSYHRSGLQKHEFYFEKISRSTLRE